MGVVALAAGCGGEGSGSGPRAATAAGSRSPPAARAACTSSTAAAWRGDLSNLEGYKATAETTSASVDNLILINDGGSDIAFTLADTALDAVEGREAFKEKVPMRVLAQIYDNYTQVVAKAGSDIKTVEDLKGKRVSVGAPNSGTEVIADRVLEAAGMDPKGDIKRQGLGVEESVPGDEGRLDRRLLLVRRPAHRRDHRPRDQRQDHDARHDRLHRQADREVRRRLPQRTIPKGTYKGVDKDVPTIAVPNYLVVSEKMDETLAHDLTKLLFDQKDDLVPCTRRPRTSTRSGAPR